jgi:hypothetical protein
MEAFPFYFLLAIVGMMLAVAWYLLFSGSAVAQAVSKFINLLILPFFGLEGHEVKIGLEPALDWSHDTFTSSVLLFCRLAGVRIVGRSDFHSSF